MKLYSPNGKASVIPHPSKVKEMIDNGWTKDKPKKPKKEDKLDGKS